MAKYLGLCWWCDRVSRPSEEGVIMWWKRLYISVWAIESLYLSIRLLWLILSNKEMPSIYNYTSIFFWFKNVSLSFYVCSWLQPLNAAPELKILIIASLSVQKLLLLLLMCAFIKLNCISWHMNIYKSYGCMSELVLTLISFI